MVFVPGSVSRKPTHVPVRFVDHPWRRSLSFACPKESNQRKRHPRRRALACGEGSLRAAGFGKKASCLLAECARSLARTRADARAFSSALRRGFRGGERRARAKALGPAFAGTTKGFFFASAAGTAALRSSRAPLGRGEQAQE